MLFLIFKNIFEIWDDNNKINRLSTSRYVLEQDLSNKILLYC